MYLDKNNIYTLYIRKHARYIVGGGNRKANTALTVLLPRFRTSALLVFCFGHARKEIANWFKTSIVTILMKLFHNLQYMLF